MAVLPIVTRELLVQARRTSTYWIRVAASCVAGFLMLWLLVAGNAPIPSVSQGKTLFSILSALAFVYCLSVGPWATADCLSAEKREGTIGLLFLTDLKGYDVVLGKLVSSSIHAAYGLLAAVPMMSLTLLFGGVTVGEVARTTLVLANTLFFSLAAGMFVSTLSRNERKAAFAAVFLVLAVAVGPYGLGFILATNFGRGPTFDLAEVVLAPSPIYAFYLTQNVVGLPRTPALISSLAQTHVIAWILLASACLIVPAFCEAQSAEVQPKPGAARWRLRRFGDAAQRLRFRRRLLERNPVFWLCSRQRFQAASAWVLVLPLALVGFWIYFRYWSAFYESALFLVFTIQVLLKVWLASEICSRWVEDRRTGALELLLSSPIQTKDLVQGQDLALRRQFGWPVAVTLGLTALAWFGIRELNLNAASTELGRTWLLMSLVALPADLRALRWVALWLGLTARGLNQAIGGSIGRVLGIRWGVYLFVVSIARTWEWIGLGRWAYVLDPWFWLVLVLAFDALLGWWARRNFLKHFRVVAAHPFDYRSPARIIADAVVPRSQRLEQGGETRTDRPQEVTAPSNNSVGADVRRLTSDSGTRDSWRWLRQITLPTRRTSPEERRPQRVRARFVWITAGLLFLVSLPAVYRYSLHWRVSRRLAALERAGEPTRAEDLERRLPPMTNEVDAAEIITRAFSGQMTWQQWPLPLRRDFPGQGKPFPGRGESLLPQMRQAIGSLLASNQTALGFLHQASSLKAGRYAVNWKAAGGQFGSQLQALHAIGQLLPAEVLWRADDQDVTGAVASTLCLLELSRSLGGQSSRALHQTRAVILGGTLTALEWVLNHCRLSDSQLGLLQKELAEIAAQNDWPDVLVGLRCAAVESYRSPPPTPVFFGTPSPRTTEIIRDWIRTQLEKWMGADDRHFLAFLELIDELLQLREVPWPRKLERIPPDDESGPDPSIALSRIRRYAFSPRRVSDFLIPSAEGETRCLLAATSLAIERYRLRHAGEVPLGLEELVPQFLAEVPRDPFDGQPLRYKRMVAGYRVYSVGWNEEDEGGDAASPPPSFRGRKAEKDIAFGVER